MKVTLVDHRRALEGYEFVLYSSSEECDSCSLKKVCLGNLESGRKYRVATVRDKEHKCPIFGKVIVVEVEECSIHGVLEESRVYSGSVVTYESLRCGEVFCENYLYCIPEGLIEGDECRIEDDLGKLRCPRGLKLRLVKLRRTV
jgi:hypothetical protein